MIHAFMLWRRQMGNSVSGPCGAGLGTARIEISLIQAFARDFQPLRFHALALFYRPQAQESSSARGVVSAQITS